MADVVRLQLPGRVPGHLDVSFDAVAKLAAGWPVASTVSPRTSAPGGVGSWVEATSTRRAPR